MLLYIIRNPLNDVTRSTSLLYVQLITGDIRHSWCFFSKNVLISTLVLIFEKKKNNTYYYSFGKYIKANYRDKIGELLNLSNCNDEKKRELKESTTFGNERHPI